MAGVDIARLMRPRSVVIVGISPEPSSAGFLMLRNLDAYAYPGAIHLVSRNRSEIGGRSCVKAIDDLPEGIDVAMLLIPRVAIEDAVKACARRKDRRNHHIRRGIRRGGRRMESHPGPHRGAGRGGRHRLVRPELPWDRRFRSPHPADFLGPAWRAPRGPRRVVVVAQSGGLAGVVRVALKAKGIPVTCTVSTGNEAVLGLEDYIAHLIEDATTQVVACFAEQIRKPRRFLAVAERARALGKPIVLLHSGKSAAAQESARSHTGALVGDYAVMETVLAHNAVIMADSLEELVDVSELMMRFPTPPTAGCAMVTDSGAVKGLTLDFCAAVGLDLPPLSSELAARLQREIPEFVGATNPLDLTAQAITHPEMYERTMTPLLADDSYGSLVLTAIVSSATEYALIKGRASLKPMLNSKNRSSSRCSATKRRFRLSSSRKRAAATYRSSARPNGRCARSPVSPNMAARWRGRDIAAQWARFRCRPCPAAACSPSISARPISRLAASRSRRAVSLARLPRGCDLAAEIGFPVVAKLQAPALAHKSDAGGVLLNIANTPALEAAWEKLQGVAAGRALALDGILIEAMAKPGVETIIGARRDPQWGPVAMVGLGGIWAEALGDIRILPVGLGEDEIVAEIRQLRGAKLLAGMRGAGPADVAALARAVQLVGATVAARA